MCQGSFWRFLFLIATFSLVKVSARLDFKLHYCRFKCTDQCEAPSQSDDPNDTKPGAFYWRDFYGAIPKDAYPLGNANQNPQTYVGLVFNPSKNGTFVTTIVDGLDYVHSVLDGEVTKITRPIQILCTMEPEKMMWVDLTLDNVNTFLSGGDKIVTGGIHRLPQNTGITASKLHYIVKATKCMITYAGYVTAFNMPLEYALLDGTIATTKTYMWLMYRPKKAGEEQENGGKNKARPFFSHRYEYSIRPGSIIPIFYKQLNIGPCSITCTNEGMSKDRKLKSNNKLLSTMSYYWMPNLVFDTKESLPVGLDSRKKTLYLGQAFNFGNWYDVGEMDAKAVRITFKRASVAERDYFHALGSNHPEKFEWINCTSDTFSKLDRSRIISGGQLDNGTQVYVGRRAEGYEIKPGSIKATENGAYISTMFGISSDFEVLMFKDPKKNS